MSSAPPLFVAEIGCNHQGDYATAFAMLRVLGRYVLEDFGTVPGREIPRVVAKFQLRDPATFAAMTEPHPNPHYAFGATYGEHRAALELGPAEHEDLAEACTGFGLGYAVSVWDPECVKLAQRLHPDFIKIPSARNQDFALIRAVLSVWEGPLVVSLGMLDQRGREKVVSYVERLGASKRTILLSCVSGYPTPDEQVSLLDVQDLNTVYGHRVGGIGWSGHVAGVGLDQVAYTLGASVIERHFTLNRTWKGTDHAASLEPDGFRRVVRDVTRVAYALEARPDGLLPCEEGPAAKLKRKPTDAVIPPEVKAQELATLER